MKISLDDRVLITGGSGLVGTALINHLNKKGFSNIYYPRSSDYNLIDSKETSKMYNEIKPDMVFHLAGFVKGIMGNKKYKGESFYKNLMIDTNAVHYAKEFNCKKIVAMGSGCVYPFPTKNKVLDESIIWMGAPHNSEDSYAHAKRAMLAQLTAYKEQYQLSYCFAISPNLFGPNDLFDIDDGHVIPSLVKKFYHASINNSNVEVWGDGSAERDFLYSKDIARSLLILMEQLEGPVNLGSGNVFSIKEVVEIIRKIFLFDKDRISWNKSMPNGQDHRSYVLDRLNGTGFKAKYNMESALEETIDWFRKNNKIAR